ncbi:MAG: RidA family protein [Planctomycetaceae bacterium]|nr:RidA family protein [Planctomycetota bacterium]NUN51375.1 RidA family protein [Planctomycetaceae bacterium]
MRRPVRTDAAPKAIGPYSQAVLCDGWLFCSGQIPLDPATGNLVGGADAAAQAEQVLRNLDAVARAAGATLADAVKCTIFLKDMGSFAKVNEVYARWFPGDAPPARATVEVARLPKDVLVEIDLVARVPEGGPTAFTEGAGFRRDR